MWKQRKLIEVADYRNGKAHEKDISENGDYIVVNSKFVSTNGAVKKFSDELIAPLKKGELAFVLSDVPNGRAIARTFLIDEDNKYSLNQRIAGIIPHSDTNSYFLHSLMNRHHYFLRFDDGAGQTNLSKKEVENWTELYPSIEEQDKIGSFFKQLDDTITLHQEKLAKLQSLKKAALQNLFPQKDETEPKVRFAYFSSSWQQRKLNELTIYQNGKGHEKKQFNQGDFELVNLNSISIDGGLKPSGKFINEAEDTLNKNDLVMVLSDVGHGDLLGRVALIPENNRFVLNQRVALLRPNKSVSPEFLFFYINTHQRYFKSQGAGMSQLNISKSSVENFANYIPVYEEQIKIGQTLKKLDDLITLHQQKLEKLQNLKKAFLQKMFI